jgi:hypothetical protein
MRRNSTIFLLSFFILGTGSLLAQTYIRPNIGLKSHETLDILKIEVSSEKTVVYLSIENRIDGGTFCADKNVYIIVSGGGRLNLKKSTGIPVCPDSYKFKSIGEKLQFRLEFPVLKKGTGWIESVEDCKENCFSFYGVILNTELNSRINEAFSMAEKGEIKEAITLYEKIIEDISEIDQGIKGALYSDIISFSIESGNKVSAENWYKKLVSSNVPRSDLYIKNLNSRGIKLFQR